MPNGWTGGQSNLEWGCDWEALVSLTGKTELRLVDKQGINRHTVSKVKALSIEMTFNTMRTIALSK